MNFFKGIRGVLAVCVVLTLIVLAAMYKYISWVDEGLWKQNVTLVNETTAQQAETISTHFASIQRSMKMRKERMEKLDSTERQRLVDWMRGLSNEYDNSFLVYQDDIVEDRGEGFDKTAVRRINREAEHGIIPPHICSRCGHKVINFYTKVHFKDGRYAYFVTELMLKRYMEGITDQFYSGQGLSYVTDRNGFVMMRPASEQEGRTLKSFFDLLREGNNDKFRIDAVAKAVQAKESGYAVLNIADELSLISYRPIKNSDWLLISVVPEAALAVETNNILCGTFALLAVVVLALSAAFVLLLIGEKDRKKAKMKELQLEATAREAKMADEAKTNFLFNMSHDIRTPMNAILGYARLMKDELQEVRNPKLLDYQEKLEQSGELLLSIINNVLDMARIESGKMELDENYAELKAVNKELYDVFKAEAEKKDIKLVYECALTHDYALCDVTKLKEVFANLISNAIKYTPEGGTVTLRDEELPCARPGYMRVKSEVIDTGIGMSKEYLPTIFDSFTRERNTTASKIAGTGLGMPIAKNLVELMGGTIEVESELGKGTRFTVILEHKLADKVHAAQVDEQAVETVCEEVIRGKHILLAEDNELNAEIAMAVLEPLGLVLERVEDGVQCVNRIQKMPSGTYDLILMDVQMPNMDGYTATQSIRALEDKAKANIPIIAMTANAFESDRQRSLEMGMNGHIAKPLEVAKLVEMLVKLLK